MLSVSIKMSVSSVLFKINLYMKLFLTNLLTDKLNENELTCNWEKNLLSKQEESTIWKQSAAAAAKSLQSCPTLCDPIDGSPPGSPVPGILQARTLAWVAISFSNAWKWKVKVKSLSRVPLLATPWTAAYQAPPSMGFSRQEYWSGVPLPSLLKSLNKHKCSLEESNYYLGLKKFSQIKCQRKWADHSQKSQNAKVTASRNKEMAN